MSRIVRGPWRSPLFRRLWAGEATSMFGSLIGGFAYSLVAILTLHATPVQIAVLNGCTTVPGLLAGPWIGVWADRIRSRPLMIAADLGQAAALASIPLAALVHVLSMAQLYAVAVITAVLTMTFDVSFRKYLPALLHPEELVAGNSIFQGTAAVAEAGGFALGGLLVQLVTAPIAVAFDSISFLASALAIGSLGGHREPGLEQPEHTGTRRSLHEIVLGGRTVWRDPVMRRLTISTACFEMAGNMVGVVIMLYFVHELHLNALQMGPVFGIGGISAFLGAVLAPRVLRRWGIPRALMGSLWFDMAGLLAIALAGGPMWLVMLCMVLGQTTDGGRTIYEIGVTSTLQERASHEVAGRVFSTYETVKSGAMVLGMAAGAVLGSVLDLRMVLAIALAGDLFVPLILVSLPKVGRSGPNTPTLVTAAR